MAVKTAPGITSSTVRFGRGITAVRALPKAKGKRPAVIILHERYGVDQHTKDLTIKLAQAGFVGLAPNLFHRFSGDRKALQKGQLRVDLRDDEALEDLNAAVDYLKQSNAVDGARIGIIGVCQTGRQPLLLAAHRDDIAGVVVLYGAIGGKEWEGNELRPTPVEKLVAKISCPVLGIFGEKDHIISMDDVVRFRGCLEWAKKNYHVRLYGDAPHGWLNDTMPGRYRKEPAKDAWRLIMAFLKKCFDGGWDPDRISCTYESDCSIQYDFTKNVRLE
ncbi:MAG TPA: dienelactone hydrolase family protein [Candidatus Binatia bacterium]|nr:dienelactone hydrolase family protein [Candidatus Binatia bacterium]